MKNNIARKTQKPNENVLSLVDNAKFKAKQAESDLFSYSVMGNVFQFQIGDSVICRTYLNEALLPSAIVIAESKDGMRHITTAVSAAFFEETIQSVVVAFKREVGNA